MHASMELKYCFHGSMMNFLDSVGGPQFHKYQRGNTYYGGGSLSDVYSKFKNAKEEGNEK